MPKISIISANLNNAEGLRRTIKSTERQAFDDYEYLIIDGGSTDGSLDVIKEYSKKITFWSSESDHGVYDALNKGIKIANGEWVIFMNSGDVFINDSVLRQIFFNEIDTNSQIIYGNTVVKGNNNKIKPPAKINKGFFFFDTICHQSIFFKRTIFDLIGSHNLNYKIVSDREFLLRAFINNLTFTYRDIDVCLWETEGLSSKNINLMNKEFIEIKNIYYNILEQILLNWREAFISFKDKLLNNICKKVDVQ
jgi:glycosyltransferase involved in cell wall biosynthesis